MGSTVKGIIAVLLTGGIVYLVYKKFYKGGAKSDAQLVIDTLNADFGFKSSHEEVVKSADAPYISAWASAIRAKIPIFVYNGAKFNTKGGKTA
jgi:hypothetical protein